MAPKRMNAKAVAAKERKAAHQATVDAEKDRKKEAELAEDWKKGADNRGVARAEASALKADEAARKRREKAELLAAEEGFASSAAKPKRASGAGMAAKKSKGKKKNELSLLEDALVGDAEKKSRQAKKVERERKEREEQRARERAEAEAVAEESQDPLLANTSAMIGALPNVDGMNVGRAANVASAAAIEASGIDGALATTSSNTIMDDSHPEKRAGALHRAFEERMMPEMKAEFPGLRRDQYKEKIWAIWKRSPENPLNQQR